MVRVVVLGAGISGHTAAAAFLKKGLGKQDEVVGLMKKEQVLLPLAPIYKRHEIEFKQARAVALYPEGDQTSSRPQLKSSGPWKATRGLGSTRPSRLVSPYFSGRFCPGRSGVSSGLT
jgi:hypothetical protein